jgi:hypothetical protein
VKGQSVGRKTEVVPTPGRFGDERPSHLFGPGVHGVIRATRLNSKCPPSQ